MNLKKLRAISGKTQQQVADETNLTQFTYSNYENGKTQPDLQTIIKLADYFGCSIDYLLGHQTKGLIYTNDLTETQSAFVKKVITLDDSTINKLEGALIRIEEENANPWNIRG